MVSMHPAAMIWSIIHLFTCLWLCVWWGNAFQIFSSKLSLLSSKNCHSRIRKDTILKLNKLTLDDYLEDRIKTNLINVNLGTIVSSLESACVEISDVVKCSNLDLTLKDGSMASVNSHGEDQNNIDVIANNIIKDKLCSIDSVSISASEEDEHPTICSSWNPSKRSLDSQDTHGVVFDPLDGSANLEAGLPTGTIFGVFRNSPGSEGVSSKVVQQKGRELAAAGYVLYSSSTQLVLTLKDGVHIFTLDEKTKRFFLSKDNVQVPETGSLLSFNEAYLNQWQPQVRQLLADLKSERFSNYKPKSSRYVGALVADVHNILFQGGLYGYPGTSKHPSGKLRLAYEANPIALLLEEAGGVATNGATSILDMSVEDIHMRTPLFLGSKREMGLLQSCLGSAHD
jgi:fructose-1,6-bisphosphatase I